VGQRVAAVAAQTIKRVTLELGGSTTRRRWAPSSLQTSGGRAPPHAGAARRRDADGPAHLYGPAGEGRLVRRGRRAGGVSRRGPGGSGLLVPADSALSRVERRPGRARGDLRSRRRGDPVRGRGGRDPTRERDDLRTVRFDLDA